MTTINDILQRYRDAERELREYRARTFHALDVVHVNLPRRYVGFGIATSTLSPPPDALGVTLENGNEWFYSLEHCRPATDADVLPEWILRRKGANG